MKNKRTAAIILVTLATALALAAVVSWLRAPRLLGKVHHEGKTYVTINPDFVRRFRPDADPRSVPPLWIPLEKTPGVSRVVMLGDSVAAGFPMVDYHLGRLLQVLWNARHPGEPIQVANLSVPGATSRDLGRFAREAMALDPDMLILCPPAKDAGSRGAYGDYRAVIEAARSRGAKVVVCLPAVNSDTPVPPPGIAPGPGVGVVDADRLLREAKAASADGPELLLDDVHLTFPGRAAVAALLADRMDSLVGTAAFGRGSASAAEWREKFPEIQKELRRDVMFTGYDEHDMWSLMSGNAGMAQKVRDLQRRAILEWDTIRILVAYDRAALQNPDDPLVHFTAGRLLGVRGEGARAEEAFARGFELQPNHAEARLNYAAMQLARGKTAEARDALEALRKFDPQAAGLDKMDAAIALREDQPARAAALLEKHLQKHPDDVSAWFMLADAQLLLGNPEAAEQSRQRAKARE